MVNPEIKESNSVMAPMALGTQQTANGSGNLNQYGSYSWTATANASGTSINWSVTISTTSSPTLRAFIMIAIPSGQTLQGSITGTSSVGGFTVTQQADGSYRAYQNTTTGASTMTINFTTTMPASTTIQSYSMTILPYVRLTASPYNAYGPYGTSSGTNSAIEAALTKLNAVVPNPTYAPETTVTINKVNQNNQPLAGAQFTLTKIGETTPSYTSNTTASNGIASFASVLTGTYILSETMVPAGYTKAPDKTITVSTTENTFTMVNTLIPTSTPVTVKATVEGANAPLAGVHFSLVSESNTYSAGPTDAQGNVTFPDVPYGTYTLKQTTTPAGYYPPTDQTVTISADVHSFAMKSTTIPSVGTITVEIRDHENNTIPIVGAVVKVVNDSTGIIYERTTDSNGNIVITDVPAGTYTITQESAPTGYTKYPGSASLTLQAQESAVVRMTNLSTDNPSGLGRIVVHSYEWPVGNTTPIPGAVYEVSNDLGQTWTGTTDANGYLVFTGLPVTGRTYTLRQVSVAHEYSDLQTPVVETGIIFQPLEFTNIYRVYNSKRDIFLLNVKVTETGDSTIPIVGAQIKVVRPADGAEFFGVTDANGSLSFDLYGGYYEVYQLTSDGAHKISDTQPEPAHVYQPITVTFDNDLIDPTTAKRNVTVNKVWGDPAPGTSTNITFIIVADGVETTTTHTLSVGTSGGSYTFNNLPKYNSDHYQIQYSVKEAPLKDYYAVYTKVKTD